MFETPSPFPSEAFVSLSGQKNKNESMKGQQNFLFSFSLALSQFPKNPSTASSLVSPNLPPTFKCPPFSSPCLTRLFHLYLATQCGNTTFVHQYCTCFHSFTHFKFILMVNLFLFFLPNISVCIEGTMHIS